MLGGGDAAVAAPDAAEGLVRGGIVCVCDCRVCCELWEGAEGEGVHTSCVELDDASIRIRAARECQSEKMTLDSVDRNVWRRDGEVDQPAAQGEKW